MEAWLAGKNRKFVIFQQNEANFENQGSPTRASPEIGAKTGASTSATAAITSAKLAKSAVDWLPVPPPTDIQSTDKKTSKHHHISYSKIA